MLLTRSSLQTQRDTQTETERMEKMSCVNRNKIRKSWNSSTYMKQNKVQIKDFKKRQMRTLYNDQGHNPKKSQKKI